MSNKLAKDKTNNNINIDDDSIKGKFRTMYAKHKKLTIVGVAGLLILGGAFMGSTVNNMYYNYLIEKEANSVGIDGKGYFFDPLLNYAIQFPQEWGYSTEDESVIEKAVKDSNTNNSPFRLSQHKLPYEVTPIVFAKDEGDLGYRSFMSVSYRGFYGDALLDGKDLLEKEISEILKVNGHTNIEFLINELDAKGETERIIFDIKADSVNEETGENTTTYYHQQSMLIGKNLCTVILGTTDTELKRANTVANLLLGIIETDPDYFYLQEDEESEETGTESKFPKLDLDDLKAEQVPNTDNSNTSDNGIKKQSIPVEGGTLEIISGTDIDIDELKEKEGIKVDDVDVNSTKDSNNQGGNSNE